MKYIVIETAQVIGGSYNNEIIFSKKKYAKKYIAYCKQIKTNHNFYIKKL